MAEATADPRAAAGTGRRPVDIPALPAHPCTGRNAQLDALQEKHTSPEQVAGLQRDVLLLHQPVWHLTVARVSPRYAVSKPGTVSTGAR